tara:strand:- start:5271 stop:6686 length:1416 start_codon:yes stop_codon:yes gene_type:complete
MFGSSLTRKFLKAYSNISYEFHLNLKESEFVTYYTEDINNSVGAINASFSFLTSSITFFIYALYLLFSLPFYIFFSFLIVCVINYFLVNYFITKRIVNIGKIIKERNPIRIKKFIDFHILYKVHKVFGISISLLNDIFKIDKDNRIDEAKAPFLISLPSITIIYSLYIIGITIFSFKFLLGSYTKYIEYLISLGLVIQRMIPTSNLILSSLNTIKFKNISLKKIYDYYKLMQKEVISDKDLNLISKNNAKKLNFNSEDNYLISIQSINYRFKNSNGFLYKNELSFDILPKSNLLITGSSGSGKTTLIDIILSLRNPTKGKVLYNSKYKYFSELLTYVPQDNIIVDGTFLDNLVLGDDTLISNKVKSEIEVILRCCLLYELINKSSQGIFQKIGYGGVQLSGGQMQRLSIARALLRNVPILLMDEPTSSLDKNTSKELMKNVLEYSSKKCISLVVVSHDTSIFQLFKKNIKL